MAHTCKTNFHSSLTHKAESTISLYFTSNFQIHQKQYYCTSRAKATKMYNSHLSHLNTAYNTEVSITTKKS